MLMIIHLEEPNAWGTRLLPIMRALDADLEDTTEIVLWESGDLPGVACALCRRGIILCACPDGSYIGTYRNSTIYVRRSERTRAVNIFKADTGKWKGELLVDFSIADFTEPIDCGLRNALRNTGRDGTGMLAVCLDPYNQHEHPVTLFGW